MTKIIDLIVKHIVDESFSLEAPSLLPILCMINASENIIKRCTSLFEKLVESAKGGLCVAFLNYLSILC